MFSTQLSDKMLEAYRPYAFDCHIAKLSASVNAMHAVNNPTSESE